MEDNYIQHHYFKKLISAECGREIQTYVEHVQTQTDAQKEDTFNMVQKNLSHFKMERDEASGAHFYSCFHKSGFFNVLPFRVVGQFGKNTNIVQDIIEPNHVLASKVFEFQSDSIDNLNQCDNWKKFTNEASILQDCDNDFIVKQIKSFTCSTHAIVFTELCVYGPIYLHLKNLTHILVRQWFIETAKAVRYLHQKNIVHRNISINNVLMRENFSIALSDFEQAEKLNHNQRLVSGRKGILGFMAPELMGADQDTSVDGFKADAFSVGMVFTCVALGVVHPLDAEGKDLLDSPYLRQDRALTSSIVSLITLSPIDRLDVIEVLQHPNGLRPADEIRNYFDEDYDEGFCEI